jgi:hypothetical protein
MSLSSPGLAVLSLHLFLCGVFISKLFIGRRMYGIVRKAMARVLFPAEARDCLYCRESKPSLCSSYFEIQWNAMEVKNGGALPQLPHTSS